MHGFEAFEHILNMSSYGNTLFYDIHIKTEYVKNNEKKIKTIYIYISC